MALVIDVLQIIFKQLSFVDVVKCKRVCRKWKEAIDCYDTYWLSQARFAMQSYVSYSFAVKSIILKIATSLNALKRKNNVFCNVIIFRFLRQLKLSLADKALLQDVCTIFYAKRCHNKHLRLPNIISSIIAYRIDLAILSGSTIYETTNLKLQVTVTNKSNKLLHFPKQPFDLGTNQFSHFSYVKPLNFQAGNFLLATPKLDAQLVPRVQPIRKKRGLELHH
jgi:hypothetical protein